MPQVQIADCALKSIFSFVVADGFDQVRSDLHRVAGFLKGRT